jgi:GT2 family glycosyltransferase
MGVDLAVVIVTYNSAHVVEQLLDSLPAALDGLTSDVVVIDNGSTDQTVAVLKERTDCRVVQSTNVGYAGGINRGVREADRADAILVLNPDVRLEPGSVQPLLTTLRLPHTGIAAPQIRSTDRTLYHSLRREPSLLRELGLRWTRISAFSEYVTDDRTYDHPQVVDWALGAVLLISRACYDSVGGWDESFFLYSEETQFSLDARKLGYLTRYVPSSVAVHIGGQSGQSEMTHSMMIVNRVRLYSRRHGTAASWCYYLLNILRELSWVARGYRRSWFAIIALVRPSSRPAELGCSGRILPR